MNRADRADDQTGDLDQTDRADDLVLTGDRVTLRTGRTEDGDALGRVFSCPGVQRWWGTQNDDEIIGYVSDRDPEVTVLIVEFGGEVVGLIQFHEEVDPQYRHAGVDLALHDDHQGRGLGPESIRLVIEHLASLGHHRIVIDPNVENHNAIKAYRRVGFQPVGTMRQYEWSESSQRWTDGLLMELLLSELVHQTQAQSVIQSESP